MRHTKFTWDFEIQTDHLVPTKRSDRAIVKRTYFAVPADDRIKIKEREKRIKYRNIDRELKMLWNMKVTVIPIVIGGLGIIPKGVLKELEDLENQRTSGDHRDYSIIKNGQNTEKSPENLRKLTDYNERPSANAGVKNSQGIIIGSGVQG